MIYIHEKIQIVVKVVLQNDQIWFIGNHHIYIRIRQSIAIIPRDLIV